MMSQLSVTVQWPPLLFLVTSGNRCSWAPGWRISWGGDEGGGWAVGGGLDVAQPEPPHIEASEAGLPQHADDQPVSN